jgi:hypothetical protein
MMTMGELSIALEITRSLMSVEEITRAKTNLE